MTAHRLAGDRLVVEVWSDVMCPFCYIGDALFAQALTQFAHRSDVEVQHRSYQLMPDLPVGRHIGLDDLLVQERGFPRAQARAMNDQVAARAAEIGLDFHLDTAIATNTRAAHRLTHFAAEHGPGHTVVQRLFRAYFTEGLDVGDHSVLAGLAAEAGLDRTAARHALDSGAFDSGVEADLDAARTFGITGVPFFLFGRRYAVSGAQPAETFLDALRTAWNDRAPAGA